MSKIVNDEWSKIAISKNLVKEYKTSDCERTVYLNNGTEFQIYLKNPNPYHLGIKIFVNDKYIGNMLVLRPGQSFWLDRYIDIDNKFLFSTYDVENSLEMKYATSKNGKVRIEFYKERETPQVQTYFKTYNDLGSTYINDCSFVATNSAATSFSINSNANSVTLKGIVDNTSKTFSASDFVETGRIEKGSKSNQKFENCDIDFDSWASRTENILILPNSRKQVRTEEIRRKYCSQCGKKVSPKDKFCSNCGAKLK